MKARKGRHWLPGVAVFAMSLLGNLNAEAADLEYELGLEYQWFPQDAEPGSGDYDNSQHGFVALSWDQSFSDNRWMLELNAHAAWDNRDDNRQRADLNNLDLIYSAENFDIKAGIATEFWGVTESRHLVDIINQAAIADNIDEEVKLGQSMVKWQTHQDWGNLQAFWLPTFRERIFPDADNRLTTSPPVDADSSRYSSNAKKKHQDFALRYANTIDSWDIGLAYFKGTSRDPLLDPLINGSQLVLSPYYEQIEQASIDLQHTGDGLLLKLEAIQRHGDRQGSYNAMVTGFEYTSVGVFDSAMDLGYLVEYLYDQRGDDATTPFQNDVFLGIRWVANNIAQTSLLIGVYQDMQISSQALRLELNTRLQDNLVLEVEGQAFRNIAVTDLLYSFRSDDYLRVTLKFSF